MISSKDIIYAGKNIMIRRLRYQEPPCSISTDLAVAGKRQGGNVSNLFHLPWCAEAYCSFDPLIGALFE